MTTKKKPIDILRISGPGFMFDDPSSCTVLFRRDGLWSRETADLQELIREHNRMEADLQKATDIIDEIEQALTRDGTTLDDIRNIIDPPRETQ